MNTRLLVAVALITFGLLATACSKSTKSGRGFHLPPGNAERGQLAFTELKCHTCHTVAGMNFPAPTASPDKVVALGGEVSRLRTYGELVTSIIHPEERISPLMSAAARKGVTKSPMPQVNDVMTVSQMVDLATFLEPRYTQIKQDYAYDALP